MAFQTRKLLEEKSKRNLVIRKFASFDNDYLFLQISGSNRTVEKSYKNDRAGRAQLEEFLGRFKSQKDLDSYFSGKGAKK